VKSEGGLSLIRCLVGESCPRTLMPHPLQHPPRYLSDCHNMLSALRNYFLRFIHIHIALIHSSLAVIMVGCSSIWERYASVTDVACKLSETNAILMLKNWILYFLVICAVKVE
jgi:hypothetical protein